MDLLERLSLDAGDYQKAYRRLGEMDAVRESVVLSTCNRVEVYGEVTSYHAGFQDLKQFLAASGELSPEEFAEPLYSHYEDDAAEHLFAVAAGLDSMVVGEPQILGQVRDALRRARQEEAAGPTLDTLFGRAVAAGRRARRETAIGTSPATLVESAVRVAQSGLGDLSGRSAAVVGAGHISSLAAHHLRERGVGRLIVVNRGVDRAERLARRVGGEAFGLTQLGDVIAACDLVVSSTGAAAAVIGPDQLGAALRARDEPRSNPLFIIDLAVPRDVDPLSDAMAGVRVLRLEDLKGLFSAGEAGPPEDEVRRALDIVAEEVAKFSAWRRHARVAPLIQALQERGDAVRRAELARAEGKIVDLTPRERQAVEALAQGIVAKLLHDPIVRLKELSRPAAGDSYARTLAELFDIDFQPGA